MYARLRVVWPNDGFMAALIELEKRTVIIEEQEEARAAPTATAAAAAKVSSPIRGPKKGGGVASSGARAASGGGGARSGGSSASGKLQRVDSSGSGRHVASGDTSPPPRLKAEPSKPLSLRRSSFGSRDSSLSLDEYISWSEFDPDEYEAARHVDRGGAGEGGSVGGRGGGGAVSGGGGGDAARAAAPLAQGDQLGMSPMLRVAPAPGHAPGTSGGSSPFGFQRAVS